MSCSDLTNVIRFLKRFLKKQTIPPFARSALLRRFGREKCNVFNQPTLSLLVFVVHVSLKIIISLYLNRCVKSVALLS